MTMEISGWIKEPLKFEAYVKRTNEKEILKTLLNTAHVRGELSIGPDDKGKKVLDLGCGLGSLTGFLAALFADCDIFALERSKPFFDYAERAVPNPGNIRFYCRHFEDYAASRFDFILCSHALQYIDSPLDEFLLRIRESLTAEGEAWLVIQEEPGINEIVRAAIPTLTKLNPHFESWFTHERVKQRLTELGIEHTSSRFISYFRALDFDHLDTEDRLCLDFILLDSYDESNSDLVERLVQLGHDIAKDGLIRHDVGISRIRR